MATKKTTTKKPTAKKSNVTQVKATTTAPRKKAASKASVTKARKSDQKYVGLRRDNENFMTFRISRQTVYWLVLGVVVIAFTAWLMKLQSDIQEIYDQIDATTAIESSIDTVQE